MQEKLKQLKQWSSRPAVKKRMYVLLVLFVAIWVAYRFVMIGVERRMVVFNPARYSAQSGLVVDTMVVKETTATLKEPITIRNNRALVSGGRVKMFKPGQRVADGKIESVSANLDFDTGMYGIRTSGVPDGLNFVEYRVTGFFIPTSALTGTSVYVMADGVASIRDVTVAYSDAETSVITSGLRDGDVLILSRVSDNQKVQVKH